MDEKDLTVGERYRLRRQRGALTQQVVADRLRIEVRMYRLIEREQFPHRRWDNQLGDRLRASAPRVRVVRPHEVLAIRRWRAGLSVADCARAVGCTPYWLTEMEHGRAKLDRLQRYWDLQPLRTEAA